MKKIGDNYYMHRSYLDTKEGKDLLPTDLYDYLINKFELDWDVLRYHRYDGTASVMEVPYFDREREPRIYAVYTIKNHRYSYWMYEGSRYYEKYNKPIYHHKWMFVPEGYDGFDIEQAKEWSKTWEQVVQKGEKRKIGYIDGWKEFLDRHNLPRD